MKKKRENEMKKDTHTHIFMYELIIITTALMMGTNNNNNYDNESVLAERSERDSNDIEEVTKNITNAQRWSTKQKNTTEP